MPSSNTNLQPGKHDTIEDVVSQLEEIRRRKETLTDHTHLNALTRAIFRNTIGSLADFDPSDPAKIISILSSLPEDVREAELESIVSEDLLEAVEPEEIKMESKAFNAKDLEPLLDEYDKYRELHDAKAIVDKIGENELLKGYDPKTVWKVVEAKIKWEAELAKRNYDEQKVDLLSDEIVLTAERIQLEFPEKSIDDNKAEELAERVVIISDESSNQAEAAKRAGKEDAFKFDKEVEREIKTLAAEVLAEIRTEERVTSIAESFAREIEKDGIILTPEKRERIVEAVRHSVERVVDDPVEKRLDEAVIEHHIDESGNLQSEVKVEPVITKVTKIIAVTNLAQEDVEKSLKRAAKGAEKAATDLWKAQGSNVDSAGAALRARKDAFLKKDFNIRDVKRLQELRYPSEGKGLAGQEKAIIEEFRAAEEFSSPQGHDYEPHQRYQVKKAEVIKGFLKSARTVRENVEFVNNARAKLAGVEEAKPLLDVVAEMTGNEKLIRSVEIVRKMVQWRDKLDTITGGLVSKAMGKASTQLGTWLENAGLQEFGAQLSVRFGGETVSAIATHLAHFSKYGLEGGLKKVLGELFANGTVTAVKAGASAASTATAAAGTVAVDGAAAAAAGTGVGIPIALIILAAQLLWEAGKILYKVGEKGISKLIELLGGSAQTVENIKDGVKKIVEMGGAAILSLGSLVISLGGLLASPVAMGGVFAAILIGIFVITFISGGQIASMVPPKIPDEQDAICVLASGVDEPAEGGEANCNPNVPASSYSGIISKDAFVSLAERWSAGGGANAAKCFNDVVCRALKAGKHPGYVLWAWLHESGASNYSINDVEDFGIHGWADVPTKDFNAQIGAFLKLDPGSKCVNDPKIGGDYWLGFATNYLTGGCDPNVMVGSNNGHTYLEAMKASFGWVSSGGLPDSVNIPKQNGPCGGGTESGERKKGPDGKEYICFGGGVPGLPPGQTINVPTLNPNIQIPQGCPRGRPVSGGYISQGPRAPNCSHETMANAVDFAVPNGTPIRSTHGGIVLIGSNNIYGHYVLVIGKCNGATVQTRYAHMPPGAAEAAGMKNNMTVSEGQVIGAVNNTGSSTGPHLHYDYKIIEGTPNPPLVDISNSIGGLSHSLEGCCSKSTCE